MSTIKEYEYNADLLGFVVIFKSGSVANTQFELQTNRLHADYGEWCLQRHGEHDVGELSEEEEEDLFDFIENNADVKARDAELNAF